VQFYTYVSTSDLNVLDAKTLQMGATEGTTPREVDMVKLSHRNWTSKGIPGFL